MKNVLTQLKWFIGLALLQALILNQMHIGGYATPFPYIYFILKFHSRASRNELLLWAFFMGLIMDMFSDTVGMNAASLTCLAFFRNTILQMITFRDLDEDFEPCVKMVGLAPFFRYVLLSSLLFCILYVILDTFSFFNWPVLIFRVLTSTLTTLFCIMGFEYMWRKKV